MPHSGSLMVSAPKDPVNEFDTSCEIKRAEEFTNVAFTQTGKPRPLLNASRLLEPGQ